jgi:uncharacterized protein YfiM (DUF2279 family)
VKKWLFSFLLLASGQVWTQDTLTVQFTSPDYTARKWQVGSGTAAAYGGSFLFLSTAWYREYPKTGFHTFNDIGEWKQVDKFGHLWTTYHTSRITSALWRWAGVSRNQSILLGTGSSLLYMFSIEYLDGHSADWGWSWGDAGANVIGASLYATQEMVWRDQRVGLKFSSHLKTYNGPDLQQKADKLFGASFQGRLLKDYNAQTYWLSANLSSFYPQSHLPKWLNVAIGYGADGMFGGYENIATDKHGNLTFDRRDIKRYRQWYLAPDVDFTRIKTKSKFLKTAFSALNVLKFPTPALEFSNGSFKLKAMAF